MEDKQKKMPFYLFVKGSGFIISPPQWVGPQQAALGAQPAQGTPDLGTNEDL